MQIPKVLLSVFLCSSSSFLFATLEEHRRFGKDLCEKTINATGDFNSKAMEDAIDDLVKDLENLNINPEKWSKAVAYYHRKNPTGIGFVIDNLIRCDDEFYKPKKGVEKIFVVTFLTEIASSFINSLVPVSKAMNVSMTKKLKAGLYCFFKEALLIRMGGTPGGDKSYVRKWVEVMSKSETKYVSDLFMRQRINPAVTDLAAQLLSIMVVYFDIPHLYRRARLHFAHRKSLDSLENELKIMQICKFANDWGVDKKFFIDLLILTAPMFDGNDYLKNAPAPLDDFDKALLVAFDEFDDYSENKTSPTECCHLSCYDKCCVFVSSHPLFFRVVNALVNTMLLYILGCPIDYLAAYLYISSSCDFLIELNDESINSTCEPYRDYIDTMDLNQIAEYNATENFDIGLVAVEDKDCVWWISPFMLLINGSLLFSNLFFFDKMIERGNSLRLKNNSGGFKNFKKQLITCLQKQVIENINNKEEEEEEDTLVVTAGAPALQRGISKDSSKTSLGSLYSLARTLNPSKSGNQKISFNQAVRFMMSANTLKHKEGSERIRKVSRVSNSTATFTLGDDTDMGNKTPSSDSKQTTEKRQRFNKSRRSSVANTLFTVNEDEKSLLSPPGSENDNEELILEEIIVGDKGKLTLSNLGKKTEHKVEDEDETSSILPSSSENDENDTQESILDDEEDMM